MEATGSRVKAVLGFNKNGNLKFLKKLVAILSSSYLLKWLMLNYFSM